ncbi:MAG: Holliday junction branch migration protein RuvA [Syntrophothermus sp.]
MFEFIKGNLAEKSPTHAVIETQGVGYFLNISLTTFSKLPPSGVCNLFTHLVVKEDAHTLFGFFSKEERELFRQLISVSGVGAGTARMILSSMDPAEIIQAIIQGNVQLLTKVKGIGGKTAQRIVIDLKDKLSKDTKPFEKLDFGYNTSKDEALSGLIILGFQKSAAEKALSRVLEKEGTALQVEELIRHALKIL